MSRVIDPGEYFQEQATRGRLTEWRRWTDGQAYELKRGVDFPQDEKVLMTSRRSSFRQWIERERERAGLPKEFMKRVHTSVPDNDTMTIYVEGGLPRVPEKDHHRVGKPPANADQPSDQPSDGVAVRRRGRVARS